MFVLLFSTVCALNLLTFSRCLNVPETFSFADDNVGETKVPHDLSEAIMITDRLLDDYMNGQHIPSMVFGISVRNQTIHTAAKGLLDIENYVPANISAMYRMASVTKTFTSTMIGALVDAGKLHYDDSIYKHLPAGVMPQKSVKGKHVDITVGQTLAHLAGFHATDIKDFFDIHFPANSTESLKEFRDAPLYFEPGTDWEYSNYGYQVLGAVIENITGRSYPDAMDSFIHNTLKLSSGTLIERDRTLLHYHPRPRYYRQDPVTNNTIPVGPFDDALFSSGIWAAGGLLSNVDDLLAYGNLLIDSYHERPNAILKNATLTQIWTKRTMKSPHFPAVLRPTNEYGYGWMIAHITEQIDSSFKQGDAYWHTGGLLGASTFLIVYPKEEIVAVTMVNKGAVSGIEAVCVKAVKTLFDFAPKK